MWVSHISESDMAETDELNDVSQVRVWVRVRVRLGLVLGLGLGLGSDKLNDVSQALHGSGADGDADKADPSQAEP